MFRFWYTFFVIGSCERSSFIVFVVLKSVFCATDFYLPKRRCPKCGVDRHLWHVAGVRVHHTSVARETKGGNEMKDEGRRTQNPRVDM